MTSPRLRATAALTLSIASFFVLPTAASALEGGLRLEPGLALPLSLPQSDRFHVGFELSLKGYLELSRYIDAQVGATLLRLGAASETSPTDPGTAWTNSLGLRLKRPHDASLGGSALSAASPWIDADMHYVRTGPNDRFGLTAGIGVSFPLDAARYAWLGPFVRYMQVIDPVHAGFDDSDARLLFLGANFELGSSPLPPPAAAQAGPPALCPACAGEGTPPRDSDGDGISDVMDNCPDVAGPPDNGGCPLYKLLVVKPDKLELREKIFFAFDEASIEPQSFPLLDEVAQALKDNRSFKVRIEGHADSTGPEDHNQTLSEDRAKSVLKYLEDHGVPSSRLSYEGFGEEKPTDTNATVDGREHNRRVDFVVHFKIVNRSTQ